MRLRSMLVFGLGYLLGSKAGKERYQELSESVRTLASSDVAKDAMERARQAVGLSAPTTSDKTSDTTATAGGDGDGGSASSEASSAQDTERDWEARGDGAWVPKDANEAEGQSGQDQPAG